MSGPLTGREIEVLQALSITPHDDKAIGQKLSIQPTSVKGHLKRIMSKLDLHSRADLVAWTYRNGHMR